MFNPHAEPVGHVAPYKRIGINEVRHCTKWCGEHGCPCGERDFSPVRSKTSAEIEERDRIWASIKGAAEGSNIRSARQISEEAIEIIDQALERIDCEDVG